MNGARARGMRLGWGVLDQGVSSLENFLLGVFVARVFGASDLGVMAMVLLAYGIALNASRALSTDSLMVRYSGDADARWRHAVATTTGVALLVGVACGTLCALTGAGILLWSGDPSLGWALVALGAGLPCLTLQDSWRFAFFASGQGAKAFVNDVVWTVILLAALAIVFVLGVPGVGWCVLAFGATAGIAAIVGALQARAVPRPRRTRQWLTEHRDLGPRFLAENLTLGIGGQIRSLTVAATGGLVAAGAVRGAEMVIAPVVTVLMGAAQVAVPEAVAALRRGDVPFGRLCRLLSGGLAGLALLWGAVVLLVFPHGIGSLLLGSVWAGAFVLVPGVVVGSAAGCLNVGPSAGLRALERADRTMRSQLMFSAVGIGSCAAGGLLWGAQGAVWGKAAGAAVGALIWWSQWAAARRDRAARVSGPIAVEPSGITGQAQATQRT